jgi:hypothetical protein
MLGSVYLSPEKHLSVGVDGILVKSMVVSGENIDIILESLLTGKWLAMPWEKSFDAVIRIDSPKRWNVIVNGKKIQAAGNSIPLTVMPDGSFK